MRTSGRVVNALLSPEEIASSVLTYLKNTGELASRGIDVNDGDKIDAFLWVSPTRKSRVRGNMIFHVVIRIDYVIEGRYMVTAETKARHASIYRFEHGALRPVDAGSLVRKYRNKIPVSEPYVWLFNVTVIEV